jgi:hypothetical protein
VTTRPTRSRPRATAKVPEPVQVNGHPAALVIGSAVFGVLAVEVVPKSGRVLEIYGTVNPDKLSNSMGALHGLR